VSLSLVLAAIALLASPTPREVPLGAWGGMGVALTVEDSGAKVELDCAHGRITGRLALDADGRFELPGTFARERPGPVRMGPSGEVEEEKGVEATYSGRLEDGVLHLTFRVGKEAGSRPLEARLGQTARLHKCL
jgi:hypothetical protein